MLEKHDHREITKNKMQILHINTLQERHQYNMVHPRRDTSTHKLPILYYYTIPQNEGIQPATNSLHFLFTLSQSLLHNHKDRFTLLQYNRNITTNNRNISEMNVT